MLGALDDRNPLAKIGSLCPSLFSCGSAANHKQIKIFGSHHNSSRRARKNARADSFLDNYTQILEEMAAQNAEFLRLV
jgi:hypothetical protein